MARITVEDCLENVDNRFELVMVSSKRARQLAVGGKEPHLPWENDKPTVMALREIEEGFVDASILDEKEEQDEFLEELESVSAAGEEGAENNAASAADGAEPQAETTTEDTSDPEAE